MKMITIGTAILALLLGIIGWEMAARSRDASSQRLIAPSRSSTPPASDADGPSSGSALSGLSEAPVALTVTRNSAPVRLDKEGAGPPPPASALLISGSASASPGAESFGIYVFHSHAILGSEKPTKSELMLLKKALVLSTAHLAGPLVTLDADGQSTPTVPIVIYSKPQWDITPVVQDHSEQLRASEVE
jgi:hypothetical protein